MGIAKPDSKGGKSRMLPNNRNFDGKQYMEADGKVYYRSYSFDKKGKHRITIRVCEINSSYKQGITFSLSSIPEFNGSLIINGQQFVPQKRKRIDYTIQNIVVGEEIVFELDMQEGVFRFANASDFLDDYPGLSEKLSAQTGRTREEFRGVSYYSGLSTAYNNGNAFWMEQLGEDKYRFHCNDHKMDDDFDDIILDVEIVSLDDK